MDFASRIGENRGVEAAIAAPFHIDADGARIDMETPHDRTTSTSVYRYYDDSGVLLYVGITSQRVARNRQHNADKVWWQWVASQKIDHFATAVEAHAREIQLIKQFRPPFNKQYNIDHGPMSAAYLAARAGDPFWSQKLAGVQSKATDVSAVVIDANWKRGEIAMRVSIVHAIAGAGALSFSDKRPVITPAGGVIGTVYAVDHEGVFTVIKARVKPGWRFSVATIGLKIVGGLVLIKRVVADDVRHLESAA